MPHPDPRAILHRLGSNRGGVTPTGAPNPAAPAGPSRSDRREAARLEREQAKQRQEEERRRALEQKEQERLARERAAAEEREAEMQRRAAEKAAKEQAAAEERAARERAKAEEHAARERARSEEHARKEAARAEAEARKQAERAEAEARKEAELRAKAEAEASAAADRRAEAEAAEKARLEQAARAAQDKRVRDETKRASKDADAEAKGRAKADAKAAKLAAQIAKAAAKKEAKQEARLAKEVAAHNAKVAAERAKTEAKAAREAKREAKHAKAGDETVAPEALPHEDDVFTPRSPKRAARLEKRIAKRATRLGLVEGETITVAVEGTVRFRRAMLLVTNFRAAVVKRSRRARVRWIPLEEVANIRHKRGASSVVITATIERMRFSMRRPAVLSRAVDTLRAEVRDARGSSASTRHSAELMQHWVDMTSTLWESSTGRARIWLRQHPAFIPLVFVLLLVAAGYVAASQYLQLF